MRVGITGHQNLGPQETIAWLTEAIEDVVLRNDIDMGITSLAIGADQLYARVLRKHHIPYIVIIPSTDYKDTFTNTNDREMYQRLLQEATEEIMLAFEKPSEHAFYEAGKQMVNLSDMVIAIWDGQPAKGLGGTGDIVKYARSAKKRVLHINPVTHKVSMI